MKRLALSSFRLRNFKAVRDSGTVRFGPFTVLIGDNGSGKSSLIEGIETFRDIVRADLDSAMGRWRGFEHVWNKAARHEFQETSDHRAHHENPVAFQLATTADGRAVRVEQKINLGEGGNSLFIEREQALIRGPQGWERLIRNEKGEATGALFRDGASMFKGLLGDTLDRWQFLALVPDAMGNPVQQQRAAGRIRLAKDGSNVAEYLHEILKTDRAVFDGLLEALRCVLPYAADVQPTLASELERAFYLKLKEQNFEVPGWLLSTGTLRMLALLACLRHPNPPPLLIVEEIENGLDPRTLNLVVAEIQAAITSGATQVIATTHSPYLLDLLHLSHIIVVERENDEPTFRRPDTDEELREWAKKFSLGELYTMGRLTGRDKT